MSLEELIAEEENDVEFDGGYKLPSHIYDALFEYQRTGVKWMWELHCQGVGGIISDEVKNTENSKKILKKLVNYLFNV